MKLTSIEDFMRRVINITFYKNENGNWLHIYSLLCASNKDDKQ